MINYLCLYSYSLCSWFDPGDGDWRGERSGLEFMAKIQSTANVVMSSRFLDSLASPLMKRIIDGNKEPQPPSKGMSFTDPKP
jgi:hypothetical protein